MAKEGIQLLRLIHLVWVIFYVQTRISLKHLFEPVCIIKLSLAGFATRLHLMLVDSIAWDNLHVIICRQTSFESKRSLRTYIKVIQDMKAWDRRWLVLVALRPVDNHSQTHESV